jgi:peptide subunit release factor 1 (eRF1)
MEEKRDLAQELERIRQELEELKKKLGSAREEKSLRELPSEALTKVLDVSKDIVKTAAEIGEKALKVVRYSIEGAVEGAKKALQEEKTEVEQKQ